MFENSDSTDDYNSLEEFAEMCDDAVSGWGDDDSVSTGEEE